MRARSPFSPLPVSSPFKQAWPPFECGGGGGCSAAAGNAVGGESGGCGESGAGMHAPLSDADGEGGSDGGGGAAGSPWAAAPPRAGTGLWAA